MSGGVDIAGLRETIRETLVREWRDDYSVASIVDALTAAVTNLTPAPVTGETTDAGEGEHWTCGACGHEGNGPDNVEWYEHTRVCPGPPATLDADDASEVEALVRLLNHPPRAGDHARARSILASDWLAAHVSAAATRAADDRAERIAQDALELVREWTQMDGRIALAGRDLADFRDQLADVISGRTP